LRLKNVSKGFLIPELDARFEVFEFLLKLEHFGSLWRLEVVLGFSDEVFECGVSEPERLKVEWYFIGIARSLPLKGYGPMVRACLWENCRRYISS